MIPNAVCISTVRADGQAFAWQLPPDSWAAPYAPNPETNEVLQDFHVSRDELVLIARSIVEQADRGAL